MAVSPNVTGPLLAGTSLTISCTVTLAVPVDSNDTVSIHWTGTDTIPPERYILNPAMRVSDNRYVGSLTISPLADQDDGTFTCTGTTSGGDVGSSTDSIAIDVRGKWCLTVILMYNFISLHLLALPAVAISPNSGMAAKAGQPYSLLCSVAEIPDLLLESSLQWTRVGGGGRVLNTSSGSGLQLHFNPLLTSDGGQYTCHVTVNVPSARESVTITASRELTVTSKFNFAKFLIHVLTPFFFTVPKPLVVLSRSHTGTVYVGTQLTLTAHISLSDVSGRNISVDINWSRDGDVIVNNSHTTVSVVGGSGTSYTAWLSLSPVTTADSGSIIATVTVSPTTPSPYILSSVATSVTDSFLEIAGIQRKRN